MLLKHGGGTEGLDLKIQAFMGILNGMAWKYSPVTWRGLYIYADFFRASFSPLMVFEKWNKIHLGSNSEIIANPLRIG